MLSKQDYAESVKWAYYSADKWQQEFDQLLRRKAATDSELASLKGLIKELKEDGEIVNLAGSYRYSRAGFLNTLYHRIESR
ncbi:MAG: hypothetical protein WBG01_10865 [Bacteroidota bacterium]